MGTKARHLSSLNLTELEGQIEALPFKVEIKTWNFIGGKWYCHFNMLEKDFLVKDVFPSEDEKIPPAKKTRKTRKKKI